MVKIRGKFPFSRLKKFNPHVFLTEDNNFQVLVGLSSLLLPVTLNKGYIRVNFYVVRFTPRKFQSPSGFA